MKILNGDALQLIGDMQSNTFDLIILDPDYQDWGNIIQTGFIDKCFDILKPDGNIIFFTKQPFDYDLRIYINEQFRREIVWTFTNGGAWVSNKMPLVSFQKLYWCVKSDNFYFNQRTGMDYGDDTKDFKRDTKVWGDYKVEGKQFEKSADGIWLRDHLHFNKPSTGEIPSKPPELIRILIRCFCKPDGKIFNPFAGSGIVEAVASQENRDIVSIEIDEERYSHIIGSFRAGVDLTETGYKSAVAKIESKSHQIPLFDI